LFEGSRTDSVPPHGDHLRVLKQAAAVAQAAGATRLLVRSDSAAYEQDTLRWLEGERHGYAISADMSSGLADAIDALPATAWHDAGEEAEAVRHWAEVTYVPTDRRANRDSPPPPRYLVLRITKTQGALFADGGATRHYAVVTNLPDPADGCGLDLIRWQRGKAGTVEHAHHVLTNELAAEALPAANFAANAAWFRLNVLLYNLLSAFKRTALPEDLHNARPKRLRFVLLDGIGKVVRHARETLLRFSQGPRRLLADRARIALAVGPPALAPRAA
jgi:Transposase DDE domain group 1